MSLKDNILNALNEANLSFDILKDYLLVDEASLNTALEELINEKRIKYLEKQNLYKIIKYKGLDLESLYDYFKEKLFLTNYLIKKHFKCNQKEIDISISTLITDKKIKKIDSYGIYSILLVGKLDLKDKYGFVSVSGFDNDFFIPGDFLSNAYDKDEVIIAPVEYSYKKIVAKIVGIEKRNKQEAYGILKVKGQKYKKYYIQPINNSFQQKIDVLGDNLDEYLGKIILVKLEYIDFNVKGKMIDVIGSLNDPSIDISLIALTHNFRSEFSEETESELEFIKDSVEDSDLKDRIDYTNKKIITIDGDYSKDFDDAVSLEILDNGNYLLGVYIADVSEYVKENTALDKDALKRGTSCYLADRVIPMLPYKLSNGICSLNPDVKRLVLAVNIEVTTKGKVINYDINEGVIKSCHRMTYSNVNKILNGDKELIKEYSDIYDMLLNMNELSHILRNIRYKRGGLEFEDTEYSFKLDFDGRPIEIIKEERYDAEKLIEDFMLLANETVAYHMNLLKLPIVYRIHETPDQEKLHQTFDVISSFGVDIKNIKGDIHPKQIQEILSNNKSNINYPIINDLLLRSMMKAKYYQDCLGHYGLALKYYCHFTSPIRRYPDLMTHRMIKKLLLHPSSNIDKDIKKYYGLIVEIAERNSKSEREAIDCEREVNDMLYAWYMSSYIGQPFKGVITSITDYGVFISLSNGAEGLLSFKDLETYYEVSDDKFMASDGKNVFKLGQEIKVIIKAASKEKRQIDFILDEGSDKYENNLPK